MVYVSVFRYSDPPSWRYVAHNSSSYTAGGPFDATGTVASNYSDRFNADAKYLSMTTSNFRWPINDILAHAALVGNPRISLRFVIPDSVEQS